MKVLADHSIAHPGWMENHLRAAYERNGQRFDLGISSPFWQLVQQDCAQADLVLVNSQFVKETFLREGFPEDKLRVTYLGVRSDFHALRDWIARPPLANGDPLRILFTGGFGFRKGAEFFLAAIRMLRQRGIPCEVTLVGSYAEARPLLAQYADLAQQIRLMGHVAQDGLKDFLREADLYLFPSLAEGCAQSGMEALAAGLCVIATRESGLPITDGETGYLVPVQDAGAIAERIAWLAKNPAALQRVGQHACAMMTDYTWEAYARNVRCVYEELIRR
jgi:glycosyltransferase involved in cell wall biosynthesis